MPDYGNYTDPELLQAIQQDDEAAFAELFRRYWKKAQLLAYSKIKSREATEDIVQDLFIALWDKRRSLTIKNLSSYIFISLKNRALNHIESNIVQKKYWTYYKDFIPSSENTADHSLRYDNLMEAIEHGLEGLPDKSRTAFYLNRLQGLSVAEIAKKLDLSEKAIQYHITRSLKHLRTFLREFTISVLPALILLSGLCIAC